jgi:hypothetical protein
MVMLIFVFARTRLDRYEELRRQFQDWRDVQIVLDRREGERRAPQPTFLGVNHRRKERRRVDIGIDSFVKLGWSVVETEERRS